MPAYLYCVLPADAPEPAVTGIDAAPIRSIRHAGVCMWVGDTRAAPRPDLDRIRAHDGVVRSAMDAGVTPVPVRFGQVLPGDDDVRAHLEAHDYRAELARVAGAVELGIRIVDPEAKAPASTAVPTQPGAGRPGRQPGGDAPGGGTAYLRMLADRIRAAERSQARSMAAARAIDAALSDWVRESRIEVSEQPPGAVVAHLVQAAGVEPYTARARELSLQHPPLRIVVTGPWPPYSFVAS